MTQLATERNTQSQPWLDTLRRVALARFNEAGYPVARRTVTKYRKMLHIPSSRQRKDWGLEQK